MARSSLQKVAASLTSCRPFVLSLGQDLCVLLLAAVHSRVILPRQNPTAHNNHFMEITRSLCLDPKCGGRRQTLEKEKHWAGLHEWFELR